MVDHAFAPRPIYTLPLPSVASSSSSSSSSSSFSRILLFPFRLPRIFFYPFFFTFFLRSFFASSLSLVISFQRARERFQIFFLFCSFLLSISFYFRRVSFLLFFSTTFWNLFGTSPVNFTWHRNSSEGKLSVVCYRVSRVHNVRISILVTHIPNGSR